MPSNTKYDSLEVNPLKLPYDISASALDHDNHRLVDGKNVYTAIGGGIRKRPGFVYDSRNMTQSSPNSNGVAWIKSMENGMRIMSAYNSTTGFFEVICDGGTFTTTLTLRDIDKSVYPHEMIEVRGKAYIKGFPTGGNKYCSVITYAAGTLAAQEPWGADAPTTPARIKGSITKLSGSITSGAGSLVVSANYGSMPATPFTIYVDDEEMTVTAVGGTTWTVTRGVNGTTAAAHLDKALVVYKPWNASAHQVDVNTYWLYSYAYKSITGQVGNRAPFETNPDNMPSSTGRFRDKKPIVVLQGHSDTTNYPRIQVFRTTDGGGTPYFLEEIDNPGAGSFEYTDDSLVSAGAATDDPVPDAILDQNDFAPTLTSNSPPLPVTSPGIIGTTDPYRCTPMAFYASRIWYGISRDLIASSNEELETGIPEESFDSSNGGVKFKFREEILNVVAATDALYVFTEKRTYILTGQSKETFQVVLLYENVGARQYCPRAAVAVKNQVAFLTNGNRIAMTQGLNQKEPLYLSDPLGDTLDKLPLKGQWDVDSREWPLEILYFTRGAFDWLICNFCSLLTAGSNLASSGTSYQLVYDFALSASERKHFWHPPWYCLRGIRPSNGSVTAPTHMWVSKNFYTGNPSLNILNRQAGTFAHGINLPESFVNVLPAVDFVWGPTGGGGLNQELIGYDWNFTPNLHRLPGGNHINNLRVPTLAPNVVCVEIGYQVQTATPTDDPVVEVYRDSLPASGPGEVLSSTNVVPRVDTALGYRAVQYQLGKTANYVTFKCGKDTSQNLVNILYYTIFFDPGGGDG